MIFNGVKFPQKLVEALIQNNVVVFAGAGVSMGLPANLPSFQDLAAFLAIGTGRQLEQPLDRFIGTLPHDPQALRKKAATKISEANNYNVLHQSLLRVFKSPESVKIVTTNFDLLFERAAEKLWSTSTNIYSAPALPLGSKFNGIVHLHGSIDSPENIVLTDGDFGRAYLTEGWARRFLVSLFEHYTVVFIGYSYDDTVLQYLARALPDKAKGKRFSLVGQWDATEKWNILGIEQLVYPQVNKDDFSELPTAIDELADFSNRSPSHWKTLISDIASNSPSNIDLSDEATIRHALQDLTKLRFFCSSANSIDWLAWLEKERALDDLFNSDVLSKSSVELANWVIKTTLEKHSDQLIQLIGKHQFRLGADFWSRLSFNVRTLDDSRNFSKWIDVLFQSEPLYVDIHTFQFLAERSFELNLHSQVIDIFEKMAASKVLIRDPLPSQLEGDFKVRGEVNIHSPEWNLNQVWENQLKPNLNSNYSEIINTCVRLLLKRHDLRKVWGGTYENFDLDSHSRETIKTNQPDQFRNTIDVIIDATRDSLEKLVALNPIEGKLWILKHQASPSQLLQRIAIHSISYISLPIVERTNLLISFNIFNYVWRQEALDFIHENYVKCPEPTKNLLIESVKSVQVNSEHREDLRTAHERLIWLNAMKSSDSKCALVDSALLDTQIEFKNLDLNPFSSGADKTNAEWIEHLSPWTVERLISESSSDWFNKIYSFKGSGNFREPSRYGLLQVVNDAINQDKAWQTKLCNFLIENDIWDSDLWPVILNVLVNWPSMKNDTALHLKILEQKPLLRNFPKNIAEILVGSVRNTGTSYIIDILEKTNEVANYVWNAVSPSSNPILNDKVDWITSAINTPEGTIAEYWILALDTANKSEEKSLAEPYRSALTSMCQTDDIRTAFTIPIITQQLTFLTYLDQQWAVDNVYHLFNSMDTQRKSQAWHGFLASRGPSKKVFDLMKETFIEAINDMETIFGDKKNRFLDFYTVATIWQHENPTITWIPGLLTKISVEDVSTFTELMGRQIKSLPSDKLNEIWNLWLRKYWQDRIEESPIRLSDKEKNSMLNWLPTLNKNFPEAVSLAIQMQNPKLDNCHFLHEIKVKNYVDAWPDDVTKLIIYFLECEPEPWSFYFLDDVLEQIKNSVVSRVLLEDLNEALLLAGRSALL